MAYIKEQKTEFGMTYNYWSIQSFNIFYTGSKGVVDVVFAGFVSKEVKETGGLLYTQKTQQIPFEIFLTGFQQMTGFTDVDIKQALYTLKDYYEFFKDAEDDI